MNACLVTYYNQNADDREYVISAKDLTTVGPVEFLQDLAVAATIGADHIERNGHHYFQGLRAFPEEVQQKILSAHPDLYRCHDGDFVTLQIEDGTLDLDTIINAPFGVAPLLDICQFTPLIEWVSITR
ncbi:hypothetical protein ACFFQF_29120 [Haladaptatus pallidirubidus]|uniref:hypothetical protein n=1 Tax=Haladaptatus pallidirubidus TaxID=1008152 RepID=UPI001D0FC97C|nr:hypothetical protein [Haladaptatus pallidirubidus]